MRVTEDDLKRWRLMCQEAYPHTTIQRLGAVEPLIDEVERLRKVLKLIGDNEYFEEENAIVAREALGIPEPKEEP